MDGVSENRGVALRPGVLVEASDPRLRGTLSLAVNSNDYRATGGPRVASGILRIENEDGAWQQLPMVSLTFPGEDTRNEPVVPVGEREYEGLIAVLRIGWDPDPWDLHGYILEGELPPAPEPFISG